MTKFIIDAYAWIEYLNGSERGKRVAEFVEQSEHEIYTSAATVAEVISKFLRTNKDPHIAITAINSMSMVVTLTQELSSEAAHIHFEAKKKVKNFGMLDAFVGATAKKLGAKILTGADDFKYFKEVVWV